MNKNSFFHFFIYIMTFPPNKIGASDKVTKMALFPYVNLTTGILLKISHGSK